MDAMIAAVARALAMGDLLGALKRVALRDDAPALALRGIAMAQLGDLERAKALLKQAASAFGPREAVARARCVVAQAEIALVSRDLGWPPGRLAAARQTLAAHGDAMNAAHALQLEVRRLLLVGRLDEAERLLAGLDPTPLAPALRAAYGLALAGIAMRRLQASSARAALRQASLAAQASGIAALTAEVGGFARALATPVARLLTHGQERLLLLDEVEALLASGALVVDACSHALRLPGQLLPLRTRPVLFALLRVLAERWPADAPRDALVLRAFRGRQADESHRARLRVEIGRLRGVLRGMADVRATRAGFQLFPAGERKVLVLAPPSDEHGAVLAFLADGESWSSSALALALGASTRTVQRALNALAQAGKVRYVGRGPARRWSVATLPGFPSTLLLPGALPGN